MLHGSGQLLPGPLAGLPATSPLAALCPHQRIYRMINALFEAIFRALTVPSQPTYARHFGQASRRGTLT